MRYQFDSPVEVGPGFKISGPYPAIEFLITKWLVAVVTCVNSNSFPLLSDIYPLSKGFGAIMSYLKVNLLLIYLLNSQNPFHLVKLV